ncbi:MAG: hypothetical protein K6A97_09180 [Lachnospiraceae bacterium]|nr:hypothetical protein [Lachnospiraceae bacterium]
MGKDIKREDRALDNILKAIDADPVKIPFTVKLKQWFIKLISNKKFAVAVKAVPILVLILLLIHTFFSISKIGNRNLAIREHHVEDGYLYITVDKASIDAERSFMESTEGETVLKPTVKGIRENIAVFKFDGNSYNIYLYSTDGRTLQLLIDGK